MHQQRLYTVHKWLFVALALPEDIAMQLLATYWLDDILSMEACSSRSKLVAYFFDKMPMHTFNTFLKPNGFNTLNNARLAILANLRMFSKHELSQLSIE